MRCFFDKRATVVDVTDKEVIDLFQDGFYHCRTFEDFGCRCLSSITHLKDMITSSTRHLWQEQAEHGWQQQQQQRSRRSQQQLLGS
jgi:hypothetical protein